MSEEKVETVRAIYDAWLRGDFDAVFRNIHADVEFSGPPDFSGGGRLYHGHDGMREALAQWIGSWEDYRFGLGKLIGCGDDVLVEGHQHGRGKGSGVEVSESIYSVWTVKGGLAVRQRMFRDRGQALEAAGLSE